MNSNTDSVFSKRGLSWLGLLMVIAVVAGAVVTGFVLMDWPENSRILTPLSLEQIISKPLEAFSFEELSLYEPTVSEIVLEGIITQEPEFTAYLFSYTTQEKKATGQINLPRGYESKQMPVIVMLRGFVDSSIYQTGVGTRNAAAVYASNGFITVAPDFLGYGGSDADDNDSFAARLKRPITVLDLIASVKQLPYIDENSVFMWGHSNGGQIALSILEITQANYPTALWAPVSKPFPYSILYYSDEADDFGKSMRNSLAAFEALYDVDKYSLHSYWDRIKAPIQLHQGGQDMEVPIWWSDELAEILREVKNEAGEAQIDLTYFRYPQADHNLRPDWNTVVQRDVAFYVDQLNTVDATVSAN